MHLLGFKGQSGAGLRRWRTGRDSKSRAGPLGGNGQSRLDMCEGCDHKAGVQVRTR